ncbi:phosphotransferase enzyme family protein [Zymoseptoria brevis]|uniref:Phosphotransferase enzyme family protein n=1 Tax=Zymoseptoria brevis TaxID=1047168 RepID=A0A0F4GRB4_9PEZI|nr:phosphotransferase enzyme family protein [Zymoseptoria brevis]
MHSEEELLTLANDLLLPLHLEATGCEVLQPLWADYGSIARLAISPRSTHSTDTPAPKTLILKSITPPPVKGSSPSESHLRKLISYEVEQHFYTKLVPLLAESTPVARCVASAAPSDSTSKQNITTILTDLSEAFPIAAEEQRSELSTSQVHAALDWLANFHGFWSTRNADLRSNRLRLPPREEQADGTSMKSPGVWLNGGYTYLATRQSEYNALQDDADSPWREALCSPLPDPLSRKSIAELVAAIIAASRSSGIANPTSPYETLLHGDVKSANLFTTADPSSSASAAFFDFQYVGLGLGVCDLAKLFTCSVPMSMLISSGEGSSSRLKGKQSKLEMREGERTLLERYRRTYEEVSGKSYPWEELDRHWNCALVDWLRFQAGWGFWGNTSWLEARVRFILADQVWMAWMQRTAADTLEFVALAREFETN